MANVCTHLTTKHMQTNPSLFSCRRSAYTASQESCAARSGQAYALAEVCALLQPLSICAVYWVQLLLRRCLLSDTASLQLQLLPDKSAPNIRNIQSLLAESRIVVLVNRCTATTTLLQLLSDSAIPRLSCPALRISASNGYQTKFAFWAGVRLRLFSQMCRRCEDSSAEEPDR